jgi:hypothetical protein
VYWWVGLVRAQWLVGVWVEKADILEVGVVEVGRSGSAGLLNERVSLDFFFIRVGVIVHSRVEIMYLVALPYSMFRHPLSPIDLVP